MTWGPTVDVPPMVEGEAAKAQRDDRKARNRLRKLGMILAVALAIAGLERCAAIGEQVSAPASTAAARRGG